MSGYLDTIKKKYGETADSKEDKEVKKEELRRAKQRFKESYRDMRLAEKALIDSAKEIKKLTYSINPKTVLPAPVLKVIKKYRLGR